MAETIAVFVCIAMMLVMIGIVAFITTAGTSWIQRRLWMRDINYLARSAAKLMREIEDHKK